MKLSSSHYSGNPLLQLKKPWYMCQQNWGDAPIILLKLGIVHHECAPQGQINLYSYLKNIERSLCAVHHKCPQKWSKFGTVNSVPNIIPQILMYHYPMRQVTGLIKQHSMTVWLHFKLGMRPNSKLFSLVLFIIFFWNFINAHILSS